MHSAVCPRRFDGALQACLFLSCHTGMKKVICCCQNVFEKLKSSLGTCGHFWLCWCIEHMTDEVGRRDNTKQMILRIDNGN